MSVLVDGLAQEAQVEVAEDLTCHTNIAVVGSDTANDEQVTLKDDEDGYELPEPARFKVEVAMIPPGKSGHALVELTLDEEEWSSGSRGSVPTYIPCARWTMELLPGGDYWGNKRGPVFTYGLDKSAAPECAPDMEDSTSSHRPYETFSSMLSDALGPAIYQASRYICREAVREFNEIRAVAGKTQTRFV